MGDLNQVWTPQPKGFSSSSEEEEEEEGVFSTSNPSPFSIGEECWVTAEKITQEIISKIQPTVLSEQRRKTVVDYIHALIKGYLGSEVFPFGSVPLKTYLPDGDIDLTALCTESVEDALANDVRNVLEAEEQNKSAKFEVKDIQYINAEVKLIKCLVQDIVVDISFNQLGGLCTLCFLEQVNRLIGKNHLFKRSILLIKAWCYYESRILGAHHGLISTYALETLVLYIFHLFKSSLNGPLAVLYMFLDYYSKFDWDNYCISLNGPVSISRLPEIVAETPDNVEGELLLDKEFLRNCVEMFSVPVKGLDSGSRSFVPKFFNIVDPLRENNNLGRSVSKGNFYRIRSAFTYGARRLGQILSSSGEIIADELNKFFMNTLDRHGNGLRPDVQVSFPVLDANESNPSSSELDMGKCIDSVGEAWFDPGIDPQSLVCERTRATLASQSDRIPGIKSENGCRRYNTESGSSLTVSATYESANGNSVSRHDMIGDAKDHVNFRVHGPKVTNETSKIPFPCVELGTLPFKRSSHPHHYLSHSVPQNGQIEEGNPDHSMETNSNFLDYKVSSRLPPATDGDHEDLASVGIVEGVLVPSPSAHPLDLLPSYSGGDSASGTGAIGTLNSLADLSEDYDNHLKNLQCAQWCHEYSYSRQFLPILVSPSSFRKHACDIFNQSIHLKRSVFPLPHMNGVVSGPQFYPVNPHISSGATFGVEELPRPRGTGTYFPNTNHRSYRERPLPGRGRNAPPVHHGYLHRPSRDNSWVIPLEGNSIAGGSQDLSQDRVMVLPSNGNPGLSESVQAGCPIWRGFPQTKDSSFHSEKLEFGTLGNLPSAPSSSEASRQPASGIHTQGSTLNLPSTPPMHRPKPVLGINQEGSTSQSYHLKNEADFPPLSISVRLEVDGQYT